MLLEATHPLFETVLPSYHPIVRMGEDLARTLTEAALTADQIAQLFAQVEKDVSAKGGNRTLLGKGVDAAKFVKKCYDWTKDLAEKGGKVVGFEKAYDKVAQELKNASGGDTGAVMRYIEKYRSYAKENPLAQKAIYGAIVLAAGVAGSISMGPAYIVLKPAVLGVLKFVDSLIKGEVITKSAIAGGEAFLAVNIAQGAVSALRDIFSGGIPTPPNIPAAGAATDAAADAATGTLSVRKAAQLGLKQLKELVASGDIKDYQSYKYALDNISQELRSQISPGAEKGLRLFPLDGQIEKLMGSEAAEASGGSIGGGTANILKKFIEINGGTPDEQSFAAGEADRLKMLRQMGNRESIDFDSTALTESQVMEAFRGTMFHEDTLTEAQVRKLFQQISEGPWGALQQVGGKIAQAAKQAGTAVAGSRAGQATAKATGSIINQLVKTGKNLANNVTADKLMSAWKTAGSKTDSNDIYEFLKSQGIDETILQAAFKAAGIKLTAAKVSPAYKKVRSIVSKLSPEDKQKFIQHLQAA